jgi:hypothetical protein
MRAIDRLGLTALKIASKDDHDVVTGADVATARSDVPLFQWTPWLCGIPA